jgi:hypothetical protein
LPQKYTVPPEPSDEIAASAAAATARVQRDFEPAQRFAGLAQHGARLALERTARLDA